MGHLWSEVERISVWMKRLIGMYEEGVIKPQLDSVHSAEDIHSAAQRITERKNIGKV